MRVGEILIKQGHVSEEAVEAALTIQTTSRKKLGEILREQNVISDTVLEDVLTFQKNLEKERYENKPSFLKQIPPFSSLNDIEIDDVSATMEWKDFSPGEVLIRQGVPGVQFFLIRRGLVKAFLEEDGKETVLGFLGEGECFGEISLLTLGPTTANVQTVEHTLCLVQNKENFLAMTRRYPSFYPFFNQLLTQRLRSVYKELLSENPGIGQVEPYLYRKQVQDMISPSQPFCRGEHTIQEAAREIVEKGWSTIVVVDDQKKPKGVLGLQEVVRSVLVEGKNPQGRVDTIMEKEFYSIDKKSYFFDALHEMVKQKTNKLIVLDDEKVAGILTGFDLLRFRGREVLSLLRNIEDAPALSELNIMRGEVEKVLRALVTDGALASQACKIVSEFNDKMVRRVIRLTEEEVGVPPSPYTWLGLGSEGRKEQTLLTDQDNAILFSEPSPVARDYFQRFSAKVVEGLSLCGFPLCKGGVMASQPKWFGDVEYWKTRAARWIGDVTSHEANVSDIYTFLDFRAVHGDQGLEKELKSHVVKLTREKPPFLRSLAEHVVDLPIPLGFFKHFIVEKSGKHKNRINLKMSGLVPLTTCIKLLAFHQGITATNTLERLQSLVEEKVISSDQGEFLEQAFETFLTLKIRNNLNDIEQGREFGNHIDPVELSTRQKQVLKEAFLAISQLQKTTRQLLKVESHDLGSIR